MLFLGLLDTVVLQKAGMPLTTLKSQKEAYSIEPKKPHALNSFSELNLQSFPI